MTGNHCCHTVNSPNDCQSSQNGKTGCIGVITRLAYLVSGVKTAPKMRTTAAKLFDLYALGECSVAKAPSGL